MILCRKSDTLLLYTPWEVVSDPEDMYQFDLGYVAGGHRTGLKIFHTKFFIIKKCDKIPVLNNFFEPEIFVVLQCFIHITFCGR